MVERRAASPSFDGGPPPSVSVVISTRDRSMFITDLLEALECQDLGCDRFEVVLVDDGSSDSTWQTVETLARQTPLRLLALRLSSSSGQGPGRNAGTAESRAQVVAYTDDDCLPRPGWLSGLLAPFLVTPGGTGAPVVVQGRTVSWSADRDRGGPWARTVWVLGPTWLFETCNIAYRRADVIAAGGFPGRGDAPSDRAGKLVGEDALLGWRVVAGGAELVFAPEAEVSHRNLPSTYLRWLDGQRGRAVFPDLVRRHPAGRRALWGRWFLAERTAAFDVAVLGVLVSAGTRRRRWLIGVVPWVWLALPEASRRGGRHPAVRLAQIGLGDLVGFGALVAASARHRSVVL